MAHVLPVGVRSRMMELDPFHSEPSKAVPLHVMWRLGGEEVYLLLLLDLCTRWG
jgi:hypothetical protein